MLNLLNFGAFLDLFIGLEPYHIAGRSLLHRLVVNLKRSDLLLKVGIMAFKLYCVANFNDPGELQYSYPNFVVIMYYFSDLRNMKE